MQLMGLKRNAESQGSLKDYALEKEGLVNNTSNILMFFVLDKSI